jgi:catechol 2,3-dioxygenase-like lactoylglutathione lyase family enzyme
MAGTIADHETDAGTPLGVNHVVLNVRDIEESHRFWTEIVGLKQVGALRPRADMGPTPAMRFYSGDRGGKMAHHDVAIVENPNLPPPLKTQPVAPSRQARRPVHVGRRR